MKKTIIDVKNGKVISKNLEDKVILVGDYLDKNSPYVENVEIILKSGVDGKEISTLVPYTGYYFELFLGDFNGDMKDEIMLRGEYGGSGGYAVAALYQYKDEKLQEIFNPEIFGEKFKVTAKYLEDKKVLVNSIFFNEYYIYDIKDKPIEYLNIIYDKNGKVNKNEKPTVSEINQAFPIKFGGKDKYYLFIRQRIVGVANADTIGYVESFLEFLENDMNLIQTGYYNFGKKEENIKNDNTNRNDEKEKIIESFPIGSMFITPKKIGWKTDEIKIDLDGDGKDEYLVPYTLDGVPYLGVLKMKNGKYSLANSHKGQGYNIRHLMIKRMKNKYYILAGFEIGGDISKLQILSFEHGKFKKIFKDDGYYYSKIYMQDLNNDGNSEVILWNKDIEEAYYIDIYEFSEHKFKKTNRFDKVYYKVVVNYYKELLNKHEESSIYMYYLALAYQKIGDKESALKITEKNLKTKNPYPETKVLLKLKEKLK